MVDVMNEPFAKTSDIGAKFRIQYKSVKFLNFQSGVTDRLKMGGDSLREVGKGQERIIQSEAYHRCLEHCEFLKCQPMRHAMVLYNRQIARGC